MTEQRHLPDANRVGVLTAAVLLTFALMRLVQAPQFPLELSLPGFYFRYPLNLATALTILAAGLTATGMDWLLRSHPALGEKSSIEHWFLPTLTTFAVGAPLAMLPPGMPWLIGFAVGGVLLVLVFLAEYVAVDPSAPNYAAATAGLTALSYALFLIVGVALRFSAVRLFLLLPALFVAAGLVSLRTLRLRISDRWEYAWAGGIALACTQIGAALHYWPVTPLQFGLVLLGPLHALTTLAAELAEGLPPRRAAAEPAVILTLAWGLALFVR